ncbi:hypothetical protein K501DRAFT_280742 [Backusella circina FSU 941]|nr:hypothetical protein K501DRAFT_280742 [Backusella circina FSU 941]
MPIVLGTWPKAAIPIDDDDDDDDNRKRVEDEFVDDDVEIESLPCSIEDFRSRSSMIQVGRADSMASRTSNNSISSWHSWDNNNLTRNTSLNTTQSSPERFSRTSICSSSSDYPVRHSSSSFHNNNNSTAGPLGHRLRYNKNEVIMDSFAESDVPTHILEPVSSPNFIANTKTAEGAYNEDSYSSSESSLDSDEDDLLAIIERKKKRERRELKKKQQALLQGQ